MSKVAPSEQAAAPEPAQHYRGVQWRIMLRHLPLLAILLAAVLYWLATYLRDELTETHRDIARRSGELAVSAIEAAMESEASHEVWDRVADRLPEGEDTWIEIINLKGEVLYATDPAMRGRIHTLNDPRCAACHEGASREAEAHWRILDDESGDFVVYAEPLDNGLACRSCHQSDGAKLGMVYARQSLGAVHQLIRTTHVGLLIAGLIALVVVALTTKALLGRYLGRPLRRLVTGAVRIGRGDLTSRIELPERTELALLADTLNVSAERLRDSIAELARQERLAAIGATIAGLSHCLKNTLNGLRGGQYVVQTALKKDDPELLEKGWGIVKTGIQGIEALSLDMLMYAGDRPLRREPVVPGDVLQDAQALYEEAAKARGVRIRLDPDERADPVPLDRYAVQRAVLNLLTNAIDACVEAETGDTVVLRSRHEPDAVVFSVEDNGTGIPPGLLERIAEGFFTTKGSKGTGLGLPVVRKIVEQHGGTLEVDSTPGRGSVFHLRFPLQADAIPAPPPAPESGPTSGEAPEPGGEPPA